ncbi:WD40 repeat-like protein [Auriculariales sp. MPI-PUGE-AT-0066]|nr:WD40 repeat-like protein [Auriculariales sp. MPI-PUGE-AT-0066]
MSATTTIATSQQQQPVLFSTRTEYAIPTQPYMLPSSWRRFQLSQLINRVLSLPQPVPFDFLVRGELLRGSLAEWCAERGIGEEETLEIEYFEATVPPQRAATLPHDDWVASIDCRQPDRFVTASYDGAVRVFSSSQAVLHTIESPAPILSAVFAGPELLVSGGHDRHGLLTRLTDDGAETYASLVLHTAPISSVCASTSGDCVITASWDGLLGVWDTTAPDSDEVPLDVLEERERGKKRRRVNGAGAGVDDRPKRKAPLEVLKGHTARVSQAVISGQGEVYSAGFDSTIRVWDAAAGVCTRTIASSEKPFTSLVLPAPHTVVASSTDRTLSMVDLRANSSAPTPGFAHPVLPTVLTAHPTDGVRVASGATDGVVRVWDVRSTKEAVSSFTAWNADNGKTKGGKVLGLSWGPSGILGVAGEGGLEIWRMRDGSAVAA